MQKVITYVYACKEWTLRFFAQSIDKLDKRYTHLLESVLVDRLQQNTNDMIQGNGSQRACSLNKMFVVFKDACSIAKWSLGIESSIVKYSLGIESFYMPCQLWTTRHHEGYNA